MGRRFLHQNQSRDRLPRASDNDILTRFDLLEQFGQPSLRFVHVYSHTRTLSNELS